MTNKEAATILIDYFKPPIIRNDGKSMAHLLALEAIGMAVEALEANPKLEDFAKFVARWLMRDDFEESAGAFAELACRRLLELGIVQKDGEYYTLGEECEKDLDSL